LIDTLFIGQNLITLDRIGSTNLHAAKLLLESSQPEGTVVWAHDQFEGRGQRGNEWKTNAFQNLTFSIILYPRFLEVGRQFALSQVVSLAVHDYLSTLVPTAVSVKWPNDILVENRKVAGILLENTLKGQFLESLVIGVGLNVNQSSFDDLPNASSLRMETGVTYQLGDLLHGLCKSIEVRYLQLRGGGTKAIEEDYHKHLFLKGQWHDFRYQGNRVNARVLEVQPSGKLLLERANGGLIACDLKEIDFNL
jgi:BirA family biotin operon repressor/biotin-[acetyl-CoA-carboxylase] ligase